MKFSRRRNEAGQVVASAGGLAIFLPIFGLLFAILFNISIMLIYLQRLAFLATIASWYYAWGVGTGYVPAWVNGLHLPNSTQVTFGGPVSANGANINTATASCNYQALGFYTVTLSDTEATMQAQY